MNVAVVCIVCVLFFCSMTLIRYVLIVFTFGSAFPILWWNKQKKMNSEIPHLLSNLDTKKTMVRCPQINNVTDTQVPRLFFLHVPKAAGSTLTSLLSQGYKAAEPSAHQFHYTTGLGSCRQKFELQQQKSRRKLIGDNYTLPYHCLAPGASSALITGHIPLSDMLTHLGAWVGSKTILISLIRHPISRTISEYNYIWQSTNHVRHKYYVENQVTLGMHVQMYNESEHGQFIFFLSRPLRQYGETRSEISQVEEVKFNIQQYFSMVGVVERLQESLEMMECILPQLLQGISTKSKVTKNRSHGKTNHSQHFLHLLTEKTRRDHMLYDWVNAKLSLQQKGCACKKIRT